MITDSISLLLSPKWLSWVAVLLFVLRIIQLRYQYGLNKYHGPFIASFTDFWRYLYTVRHPSTIPALELQRKYGNIVRIGPRALLFSSPQAVSDIYGAGKDFVKSEFYPVAAGVANGVAIPSLFSNTNELAHSKLRRSVSNAFSMSTLVSYEPYVDDTIDTLFHQLRERFAGRSGPEGVVDLPLWLQYYAFDMIGELTYSARHGFLETGDDVDGIIAYLGVYMDYFSKIGQMPILDFLFWKNPVLMFLSRHGLYDSTFPAVPFARRAMTQRLSETLDEKGEEKGGREDLLSKFFKAKKEHPDSMSDKDILAMALSMVFAGSETTGIALTSLFYFLLKNPLCLQRLRNEIESNIGQDDDLLSSKAATALTGRSRIPYSKIQALPYLQACMKESFRMHPPPAFNLERVTPSSGAIVCGEQLPGNDIVACNTWTLHRNKAVFGEDVEVFRPERG